MSHAATRLGAGFGIAFSSGENRRDTQGTESCSHPNASPTVPKGADRQRKARLLQPGAPTIAAPCDEISTVHLGSHREAGDGLSVLSHTRFFDIAFLTQNVATNCLITFFVERGNGILRRVFDCYKKPRRCPSARASGCVCVPIPMPLPPFVSSKRTDGTKWRFGDFGPCGASVAEGPAQTKGAGPAMMRRRGKRVRRAVPRSTGRDGRIPHFQQGGFERPGAIRRQVASVMLFDRSHAVVDSVGGELEV